MFCPKCGQQNEDGSRFCQSCGNSLHHSVRQTQINIGSKKIFIIPMVVLLIAISVVIYWVFFHGKRLTRIEGIEEKKEALLWMEKHGKVGYINKSGKFKEIDNKEVIKAKLIEVTNAMSNVASAVAAFRQENDTWPNCATITEIQTSLGVSLSNVNVISKMSVTDGIIATLVRGIDGSVDGKGLIVTPTLMKDGSIVWNWSGANDMPEAFIPKR